MTRAWIALALALSPALAAAQGAPLSSADPTAAELEAARQILGAPVGPALSGSELDARTDEVAALLRCPVCQGLSVADSPSTMAQNMKREIRELLARGYDDQQVMAYFERSYGEFVRLKPPLRGINWLLWLAPALALGGGGYVLARVMGRRRPVAAPEPAPPADDPVLARYRDRVRALAYGEGEPAAGPPPTDPPGKKH